MATLKTDLSTPQPAFLALGDIHLSGRIWGSRPDVTGDDILGLDNLLDQGIRLQVPVVLVGDLYDTANQTDPRLILAFQRWVERARNHGIAVYALQGNHDRRAVPWYAVDPYVQHIGDGREVSIGGLTCRGYDFDLQDRIHGRLKELADLPAPQVLFLHQAARQALKFDGAWNCDLAEVPPGIPLTVLGDIHRPMSGEIRPGQEWAYTGSGCPRSTEEFGARSVLRVNRDLSWSRIPVPGRPMRHEVWRDGTADELLSWVEETREMAETTSLAHFLKLTYTQARVEEVNALKGLLAGLGLRQPVLYWDDLVVGRSEAPDGQAGPLSVPTPRAILEGLLPDSPRALNLALDLVTSPAPLPDTLQGHRVQFVDTYRPGAP